MIVIECTYDTYVSMNTTAVRVLESRQMRIPVTRFALTRLVDVVAGGADMKNYDL